MRQAIGQQLAQLLGRGAGLDVDPGLRDRLAQVGDRQRRAREHVARGLPRQADGDVKAVRVGDGRIDFAREGPAADPGQEEFVGVRGENCCMARDYRGHARAVRGASACSDEDRPADRTSPRENVAARPAPCWPPRATGRTRSRRRHRGTGTPRPPRARPRCRRRPRVPARGPPERARASCEPPRVKLMQCQSIARSLARRRAGRAIGGPGRGHALLRQWAGAPVVKFGQTLRTSKIPRLHGHGGSRSAPGAPSSMSQVHQYSRQPWSMREHGVALQGDAPPAGTPRLRHRSHAGSGRHGSRGRPGV